MASQGWVAVDRKIFENLIWDNDEPFDRRSAWIDLLLLVNHADNKVLIDGKVITVKRGQRITSILFLSKRWKWSRTKTKSFLELLQNENMIKVEIEPKKKTIITIVNYSKYQDIQSEKHLQKKDIKKDISEPLQSQEYSETEYKEKDNRKTTERQQKDINNNDNNDNNDIDEIEIYILNILEQTLNKKISQSSVNKLIKAYGVDNVKLLAEKINESTWLKENINLNKISKKFFTSILEDKYKDYEKKEEVEDDKYDWYKPLEL